MKKISAICSFICAMLLLGGCSAGDNLEETAALSFLDDVDSIEVTFDFYPSEMPRALNADEIAAITEWALELELKQVPLDETETPNNYAGGVAWHFNVNDGEFTFSYADYEGSAICIDNEWYAVKNPSDPPIEGTITLNEQI